MATRLALAIIGAAAICFTCGGCTTHANAKSNGEAALRVVLTIEPTDMDPARVPDVMTSEVVQHTFQGLTRFNEKNEIEPCLAEKWDVSPDGKTYTFHLR